MSKTKMAKADNDHPWKQIFSKFLKEGVLYIDSELHDLIDWPKGVEFLEQELHEAIKTRFRGAKICDKLAKVYLKNGKQVFLLIHIEIEANPKVIFAFRFYWYRILILDKHKTDNIYSMVVYTGRKSKNQVSKYEFKLAKNQVQFDYPVIKVWELDEEELKKSDNIFALFLLAQKYANQTKENMDKRLAFRKHLFNLAQEKKISRQIIFQALIFVKYLTALPTDLELDYKSYADNKLNKKQSSMITLEDVKMIDDWAQMSSGNSYQKLLREAEARAEAAKVAAKEAAKAAKEAAKAAAKEAAKAAAFKSKKEIIFNSHFNLKLDVKLISKLVKMTQKEIKKIIAEEELRRAKISAKNN